MIFDRILLTVDCPEVLKIIDSRSFSNHEYRRQLKDVEYLDVICVFLVLRHSLSPYYVINLLDKDLPFTGIIEATNVVSSNHFGGRHIVYLPKYITHDDPLNERSEEEILDIFH